MIVSPAKLSTKNDCAAEDRKEITLPTEQL
jgi:hypothetical protein